MHKLRHKREKLALLQHPALSTPEFYERSSNGLWHIYSTVNIHFITQLPPVFLETGNNLWYRNSTGPMASSSTPEAEEVLWSLGVGEKLPKWLKESRKRATMATIATMLEKKDQIAGRIGWQDSSFTPW